MGDPLLHSFTDRRQRRADFVQVSGWTASWIARPREGGGGGVARPLGDGKGDAFVIYYNYYIYIVYIYINIYNLMVSFQALRFDALAWIDGAKNMTLKYFEVRYTLCDWESTSSKLWIGLSDLDRPGL